MVKVKGPGCSIAASGKFADVMQFAMTKRGCVAGGRRRPRQPRTEAQRAARIFMSFITRQWKTLTEDEKASWTAAAIATGLPEYFRYVQENCNRMKTEPGQAAAPNTFECWPTKKYPAVDDDVGCLTRNHSYTPGVGQIVHRFQAYNNVDNWTIIYHRDSVEHPLPVFASIVHVELVDENGWYEAVIKNLPSGVQTIRWIQTTTGGSSKPTYHYFTETVLG